MAKNLLKRAEFYDMFGFIGFLMIIFISIWQNDKIDLSAQIILITIGIVGAIVDGTIVYSNFLRK